MRPTTLKNIALGLSGGVDSSLSAHLLVEAGYNVTGVYLECWRAPGCRTDQDRKDALSVALQLNIPFTVLDFKEEYRERVVEYFFAEYKVGRTPNPDVMCNKEIKFGMFYDWAMANGFDAVATGHYAQIGVLNNVKNVDRCEKFHSLFSSVDAWKDQTYFLHQMTQEHLAHTQFPIGHLNKEGVRAAAKQRMIPVAEKKDSVGICFIGDIKVHAFLKERLGENPGEVVDSKGRVIGRHQGLWFYTVGQRHGFTIYPKTVFTDHNGESVDHHNIPPFYVISKDAQTNRLIVGFGRETYQRVFSVAELHWNIPNLVHVLEKARSLQLLVRIRHTGQLHACTLHTDTFEVKLDEPIQGIAEGQSAVFYLKSSQLPMNITVASPENQSNEHYICLGGAVISSIK